MPIQDEKKVFMFDENSKLAELIGIILGDGNVYYSRGRKYLLRISSNQAEEVRYRYYTKSLMEDIFNFTPKIYRKKNKNGIDLVIYSKLIIESLIGTGIIPGDKVKNQVSVPEWIKKSKDFQIGCLRGLFDTDGSIYLRNTQHSFGLNFKNGSLALIKDFKEMCENINVNTQQIPKPKIYHNPNTSIKYKAFQITIENKYEISKFLYQVRPKKWDFRTKLIGLALLLFNNSKTRIKIKNELYKQFHDKKIHFSREYETFLTNLCEKCHLCVNKQNIINSIKNALSDKRRRKNKLNFYGINVIKDLEMII